ncbi:hypothetical protein ANTRET_LOCUS345 [Anthophora retusa]
MPRIKIRKINKGVKDIKVKKRQKTLEENIASPITMSYRASNKIFNKKQEQIIESYVTKAAEMYQDFSPKGVRKFSYELAKKYELSMPNQWEQNKMASED